MPKLYDSLTKELRDFPAETGRPVSMYACGPTVYHYASIGNLRTFLTVDLLRRHLESKGVEVRLVMNITDVGHMLNDADVGEDKMEAAAAKEGKTPEEIARFYEEAFMRDMEELRFKPAWKHPRATEHIPEMVALVEKLLEDGHAYSTEKGDVYFDVASFKGYGKLSGNAVDDLVAGARVDVKEDKRHPADFALWISDPRHVMQWEGPRGIRGYPGWHLECSAMAKEYLGDTLDLHVGGEDLKFPHHECEIAQSESANGAPFARHWMHVSFLLVEGEKMSKSKGNAYILTDLIAKGHEPAAVRWLLLSAHYRTQLNFTLAGLDAAGKTVAYYRGLLARLRAAAGALVVPASLEATAAFVAAMDEDMNVSKALALVHESAKEANRALDEGALSPEAAAATHMFIASALGDTFGIDLSAPAEEIPEEAKILAEERQAARDRKDWAESDRLRDEISATGWSVEDTPQGPKLKKA